jgi:DNA-binding SARP family transcriptional activator
VVANLDKSDQSRLAHMTEDTLRKALLGATPASGGLGWIMTLRQQAERAPYLAALRLIFGSVFRHEHLDGERYPASMLSSLCADALQAGIEVDYVTQLIEKRRLRPDGPCVYWPWPMRVYTLGRFSLVKDGQAVTFTGKSPRKPLELLQALIALGGREVHTSLLIRALWPDEGSRDLRKSFDNTLHRLRQILGHDEAVTLRDAKLTLDIQHCWVDAWAFDHMAGRLCGGEEVSPQFAHDTRRLYQGHFLQREAEMPWLLPYRERLRSRFHRFILSQGERLERAGHWESAGQMYEHAIEIDNLAEILYRHLMVCLLNRGEFAGALCVYRRCCYLLSIVLGVKPSLETESVLRRIKAGLPD